MFPVPYDGGRSSYSGGKDDGGACLGCVLLLALYLAPYVIFYYVFEALFQNGWAGVWLVLGLEVLYVGWKSLTS